MENSTRRSIKNFIELGKLNIMIPVSLSGFTGFFLKQPVFSSKIFLVTAAILMMAVSASAINQIQEVETDRKMNRTRNRPLPSGKISTGAAVRFAVIVFLTGCILFMLAGTFSALIVSLVTIAWYNGVYTPLKRQTPYAVIPGALTGALPPLIGWVAAGGDPFDISIILVQVLFFIGQIPHFWLLIIRYGDEYNNAGLPSMTTVMSIKRISSLVRVFVVISAIITVLLVLSGVVHNVYITRALIVFPCLLILAFAGYRHGDNSAGYSLLLNIYFLLIMFMLISDRIIS